MLLSAIYSQNAFANSNYFMQKYKEMHYFYVIPNFWSVVYIHLL